MSLPVLISVALAPGWYFVGAFATVVARAAAAAIAAKAIRPRIRAVIVFSRLAMYFDRVSQLMRAHASIGLSRGAKQHCCAPPIMIDAWRHLLLGGADGLKLNRRIGPRHPKLGRLGFRAARWLAARFMGAAGFHQLDSDFAHQHISQVREKIPLGETLYPAGILPPRTHNSRLALFEVTPAYRL